MEVFLADMPIMVNHQQTWTSNHQITIDCAILQKKKELVVHLAIRHCLTSKEAHHSKSTGQFIDTRSSTKNRLIASLATQTVLTSL